MPCLQSLSAKAVVFVVLFISVQFAHGQWDPPVNFYSNANGTGATLQNQLRSIMTSGHIQRMYGDFRFSAALSDQDPNNSSRILLTYNGESVNGAWDSGQTWNREHVWPQSRQPGTVNNGSQGNLGDPHALRPCNPIVNENRASMPFGFADTFGSFDDLGSFWFPGDDCKGDVARSLFYSETRWSSLGLSLTNNFPSGNQMGELSSLIAWHYLDAPDEFERRRNHVIFSSSFNPQYFTNNRNAYIDRPEFVWSIYMNQQNDSMIAIDGGTDSGSGVTSLTINFGSALVGTTLPATQSVTLDKFGDDGTYYSLLESGGATVDLDQTDRRAFRTGGTDSVTFDVSLDYNPNLPGLKTGFVVVDNLDVTGQGGVGRGANDGDDFIVPSLRILDHSNASFNSDSDQDTLTIDLGEVEEGSSNPTADVEIYNLASVFGTEDTAALDFDSSQSGNSDIILQGAGFSDLAAGQSQSITVVGNASSVGDYSTAFALNFSDEDLPGETSQLLVLEVTYQIVDSKVLHGDVNGDGVINLLDVEPFVELLSTGIFQAEADTNKDGVVNLLDVEPFVELLSGGN